MYSDRSAKKAPDGTVSVVNKYSAGGEDFIINNVQPGKIDSVAGQCRFKNFIYFGF
jgi:hypothetical protein